MADQSRVIPTGRLLQVPTWIGEVMYLQNFVIIHGSSGTPFPMLLGRLGLYSAKVMVNWGSKEFVVGKPPVRIPWKREEYLGETSNSDGNTSGWTSLEDSDSITSYFVDHFAETEEADFRFLDPIPETSERDEEIRVTDCPRQEDKSMGESNLPLMIDWIRHQISEGGLPPVGLKEGNMELPWSNI